MILTSRDDTGSASRDLSAIDITEFYPKQASNNK